MTTLLDECRAHAPGWMAAEGWRDQTRSVIDWGEIGPGAWIRVINCGLNGAVRVLGCCASEASWMAEAPRSRIAPALAYVAGEVRAEMVARGLAEPEADAPGPVCACCFARGCACVAHLPRTVTRYDDAGLAMHSDKDGPR